MAVLIVLLGYLADLKFRPNIAGSGASCEAKESEGFHWPAFSLIDISSSPVQKIQDQKAVREGTKLPARVAGEELHGQIAERAPGFLPGPPAIPVPELKLALANFNKIFDAYYKTKLARDDLANWRGDKASKASRLAASKSEIMADIHQVNLTYSIDHNLDLVLDTSLVSAGSGVPLLLHARSGLDDITDSIIKLVNADHS